MYDSRLPCIIMHGGLWITDLKIHIKLLIVVAKQINVPPAMLMRRSNKCLYLGDLLRICITADSVTVSGNLSTIIHYFFKCGQAAISVENFSNDVDCLRALTIFLLAFPPPSTPTCVPVNFCCSFCIAASTIAAAGSITAS